MRDTSRPLIAERGICAHASGLHTGPHCARFSETRPPGEVAQVHRAGRPSKGEGATVLLRTIMWRKAGISAIALAGLVTLATALAPAASAAPGRAGPQAAPPVVRWHYGVKGSSGGVSNQLLQIRNASTATGARAVIRKPSGRTTQRWYSIFLGV